MLQGRTKWINKRGFPEKYLFDGQQDWSLVLPSGFGTASPTSKAKEKTGWNSGMVGIFYWESVTLKNIIFSVLKIRFVRFQLFVPMPDVG